MNTATIFFSLATMVASAVAVHQVVHDHHAHPSYKYSYGVADKHTGDQKHANEERDGGVTKGSYSLVQPDGVIRTVNYIVTPHGGFQAQVLNKGVAGHPAGHGGWGSGIGIGGAGLGLGLGGSRSVVGGLGGAGLGIGAGQGWGWGGLGGGLGGAGLGLRGDLGGAGRGIGAGIIG